MAEENTKRITRWDLFKVFLGSFFLQAVWNYRSLLSIGFSSCLLPIASKLYPGTGDRLKMLVRHLKFFNAHPYMASYALGVVVRLEEQAARESCETSDLLDRLKNLLISPLGAIGDRLFWATIKPASLIFGMAWIISFPEAHYRLAGLAAAFLLYNAPHFYVRYRGLIEGYKYGTQIYKHIYPGRFEKIRRFYLGVLVLSLTWFAAILVYRLNGQQPIQLLFLVGALGIAWLLEKKTKNFYITTFSTALLSLMLGIIFF
ncbi:MAG: PTS mannose transporter subunit IID [Calditrichia bacterium]